MTYEEYKTLQPGDIVAWGKIHYEVCEQPEKFKNYNKEDYVWVCKDEKTRDGYNGFPWEESCCTIVSQKSVKSVEEFL